MGTELSIKDKLRKNSSILVSSIAGKEERKEKGSKEKRGGFVHIIGNIDRY